jgi:hypothetical protein
MAIYGYGSFANLRKHANPLISPRRRIVNKDAGFMRISEDLRMARSGFESRRSRQHLLAFLRVLLLLGPF